MALKDLTALVPADFGTIIPAKLAALPIVAGLAVGTAAAATFMIAPAATETAAVTRPAPSTQVASVKPVVAVTRQATAADRPCAEQTWPYIDAKCRPASTDQTRNVRLVTAPSSSEAAGVSSAASAAAARAAEPGLITGDTVLRQPQPAAREIEPEFATPQRRSKRESRRQRERRWAEQAYQVPSEFRDRRGRAVIVVRPLRLDFR